MFSLFHKNHVLTARILTNAINRPSHTFKFKRQCKTTLDIFQQYSKYRYDKKHGLLTTTCNYFSTKQILTKHIEETNADENESKLDLKSGDVAVKILHEVGDEPRFVKTYEISNVHQECKNTANTFKGAQKQFINNYSPMFKSMVGKDTHLKYTYLRSGSSKEDLSWKCILRIIEPVHMEIRTVARSKSSAGDLASLIALDELFGRRLISSKGKPILSEDLKKVATADVSIPVDKLDTSMIQSLPVLRTLADQFENDVEPLLKSFIEEEARRLDEKDIQDQETENKTDTKIDIPLDGDFLQQISKFQNGNTDKRNGQLYNRAQFLLERSNASSEKELPIQQYKNNIVDMINQNQISIIKGEPGCGKSTQVPKMILDDWSLKNKGSECNILITQPRRISAVSLAKRVAKERKEQLGDCVGYHVRLDHVIPRQGGHIQFITTGILLMRLQSEKGLDKVSHIILDEAHERDVSTDLLLLLTKRLTERNPNIRLIVMSATLNAEMFQRYYQDSPVLHIPGFTYPVERHYLTPENCKEWRLSSKDEECHNLTNSPMPITTSTHISGLIKWIHQNKPPGAILCFLPGWQEIISIDKELKFHDDTLKVAIAHSKLDTDVQATIFDHPPPGIRKVVLATNVAETSITIDDVSYVVDTGCHKETRFNPKENIVSLDNHWISKANVNQRAGRAGRTKPGESFHLYSEDRFKKMADYSLPEILRRPLEEVLLTCKIYSNEKSETLMDHLPEPPDPNSIKSAIKDLKLMDVFDNDENLTALGKRIATMQLHPKLSKALIESVIFRCTLPIANIITLLSSPERSIFENIMNNQTKEIIRNTKASRSPYSDHIAMSKLFEEWADHYNKRKLSFFRENEMLHQRNLKYLYNVREQMMNNLYSNRMLDEMSDWMTRLDYVNRLANVDEYIKSVLYLGLDNLLVHKKKKGKNRLITEKEQTSTLTRESVNSGLKSPPTAFMTYSDATTSLQRRMTIVRDTSFISPLSVILFRRGKADLLKQTEVGDKIPLESGECLLRLKNEQNQYTIVLSNESDAELLLKYRNIISTLNSFFISHLGHPTSEENEERMRKIDDYWANFLKNLSDVFSHYGRQIDETRKGNHEPNKQGSTYRTERRKW